MSKDAQWDMMRKYRANKVPMIKQIMRGARDQVLWKRTNHGKKGVLF